MERRELICIGCPLGCMISVEMEALEVRNVTGNTCPRGKAYAVKEVTHPERSVTTTVRVRGGNRPLVSVKTATDIPKERIFDVMKALSQVVVEAPVYIGDVLVENVAGTHVNVIATSKVTG